jgi:hypothetical protein
MVEGIEFEKRLSFSKRIKVDADGESVGITLSEVEGYVSDFERPSERRPAGRGSREIAMSYTSFISSDGKLSLIYLLKNLAFEGAFINPMYNRTGTL